MKQGADPTLIQIQGGRFINSQGRQGGQVAGRPAEVVEAREASYTPSPFLLEIHGFREGFRHRPRHCQVRIHARTSASVLHRPAGRPPKRYAREENRSRSSTSQCWRDSGGQFGFRALGERRLDPGFRFRRKGTMRDHSAIRRNAGQNLFPGDLSE